MRSAAREKIPDFGGFSLSGKAKGRRDRELLFSALIWPGHCIKGKRKLRGHLTPILTITVPVWLTSDAAGPGVSSAAFPLGVRDVCGSSSTGEWTMERVSPISLRKSHVSTAFGMRR